MKSIPFDEAVTPSGRVLRARVAEGYAPAVKITGDPCRSKTVSANPDHIVADPLLRRATFERSIRMRGLQSGIKVAANVPSPQNTNGATTLEPNVAQPLNLGLGSTSIRWAHRAS